MIVQLHRFAAFAILMACCVAVVPMHAAQPKNTATREYEVKAVFLYNFARFVQWPASEEGDAQPFVIGVLGDDPFGALLDEAVRGERVGSRRLQVRRIANLEEAARCDQVFIARSEQHRLDAILKHLGNRPILTVSDIPQFAEQGGMVGLVSAGGRTKIRINLEAAKAADLSISSKLLRPAEIVTTRKTTRMKRFEAPARLAVSPRTGGASQANCPRGNRSHASARRPHAATREQNAALQNLLKLGRGHESRQERTFTAAREGEQ